MSWFKKGKDINKLLEEGYTISQVDGALLPPGVIDHDTPAREPEKPSMPYSKTMHIWADVDGSRKRR